MAPNCTHISSLEIGGPPESPAEIFFAVEGLSGSGKGHA